MHPLWGSVASFDRELNLARAAGARTVRADLAWATLEEAGRGRYSRWYVKRADIFIAHARARGLKVIVDFWGSPCWASSAPGSMKQSCRSGWWERGVAGYAPTNARDYADAAAYVARRWGARLAAIEVWNEPNIADFMRNSDPARRYAGILRAAYRRIKTEAPRLPVLGGGLAGGDTTFLKGLYAHGIKGHHDGISIHPFDAADPNLRPRGAFLTAVPRVRRLMINKSEGGKGLWLTEVGFSTCKWDSRCVPSERRQSLYTEAVARTAHRFPYVKALLFYNFRNRTTDSADFQGNFGVIRRDFSKKPTYEGFRRAMR